MCFKRRMGKKQTWAFILTYSIQIMSHFRSLPYLTSPKSDTSQDSDETQFLCGAATLLFCSVVGIPSFPHLCSVSLPITYPTCLSANGQCIVYIVCYMHLLLTNTHLSLGYITIITLS